MCTDNECVLEHMVRQVIAHTCKREFNNCKSHNKVGSTSGSKDAPISCTQAQPCIPNIWCTSCASDANQAMCSLLM